MLTLFLLVSVAKVWGESLDVSTKDHSLKIDTLCAKDVTGRAKIAVTSDIDLDITVVCRDGFLGKPKAADKVHYLQEVAYSNKDKEMCRFDKKTDANVFTVKFYINKKDGKESASLRKLRHDFILTCTYDESGHSLSKDKTVSYKSVPFKQHLYDFGGKIKSKITLQLAESSGKQATSPIPLGKTIRLVARVTGSDYVRALTCSATNGAINHTILSAGCGDGIVIPKDQGFKTFGRVVYSPFFSSFRLRGNPSLVFSCKFVACTSGRCDGSSCDRKRTKRNAEEQDSMTVESRSVVVEKNQKKPQVVRINVHSDGKDQKEEQYDGMVADQGYAMSEAQSEVSKDQGAGTEVSESKVSQDQGATDASTEEVSDISQDQGVDADSSTELSESDIAQDKTVDADSPKVWKSDVSQDQGATAYASTEEFPESDVSQDKGATADASRDADTLTEKVSEFEVSQDQGANEASEVSELDVSQDQGTDADAADVSQSIVSQDQGTDAATEVTESEVSQNHGVDADAAEVSESDVFQDQGATADASTEEISESEVSQDQSVDASTEVTESDVPQDQGVDAEAAKEEVLESDVSQDQGVKFDASTVSQDEDLDADASEKSPVAEPQSEENENLSLEKKSDDNVDDDKYSNDLSHGDNQIHEDMPLDLQQDRVRVMSLDSPVTEKLNEGDIPLAEDTLKQDQPESEDLQELQAEPAALNEDLPLENLKQDAPAESAAPNEQELNQDIPAEWTSIKDLPKENELNEDQPAGNEEALSNRALYKDANDQGSMKQLYKDVPSEILSQDIPVNGVHNHDDLPAFQQILNQDFPDESTSSEESGSSSEEDGSEEGGSEEGGSSSEEGDSEEGGSSEEDGSEEVNTDEGETNNLDIADLPEAKVPSNENENTGKSVDSDGVLSETASVNEGPRSGDEGFSEGRLAQDSFQDATENEDGVNISEDSDTDPNTLEEGNLEGNGQTEDSNNFSEDSETDTNTLEEGTLEEMGQTENSNNVSDKYSEPETPAGQESEQEVEPVAQPEPEAVPVAEPSAPDVAVW